MNYYVLYLVANLCEHSVWSTVDCQSNVNDLTKRVSPDGCQTGEKDDDWLWHFFLAQSDITIPVASLARTIADWFTWLPSARLFHFWRSTRLVEVGGVVHGVLSAIGWQYSRLWPPKTIYTFILLLHDRLVTNGYAQKLTFSIVPEGINPDWVVT